MPMQNTNQKSVIITGASGKIGLKLVRIFLDLDYCVFAVYNSNYNAFARAGLRPAPTFTPIKADLATELPKIFDIIEQNKDTLSCLVNSAATFEKGSLNDTNNLISTLEINTFTPLKLSQKFAEIVKNGNVINILDGNIYGYNSNFQNYRISKRFLESLTKDSALCFAPQIRVNALALGMLEEETTESNTLAKAKEILKYEISDADIKYSIEFLLDSKSITGQTIYLDNGVNLR